MADHARRIIYLILFSLLIWDAAILRSQESPYNYFHKGIALPNVQLTPGAIRTTDSKEICASTFRTAPFRHTTQSTKNKVYAEYGVAPNRGLCKGGCEVDHLIPLELGGLDDIRDLWPQPSQPTPGFHEKDKLENYLHRQVCDGKVSLADAQAALRIDWYAAYLQMEKSNGK